MVYSKVFINYLYNQDVASILNNPSFISIDYVAQPISLLFYSRIRPCQRCSNFIYLFFFSTFHSKELLYIFLYFATPGFVSYDFINKKSEMYQILEPQTY